MKKTGFIIIVSLLFQLVNAQEKQWNLDDCIQYAVEHNPLRTKQEAQNKIYKQDQREAFGGFLPSLNVNTDAYMNFGRGIDPVTNTYISTNTFYNDYSVSSSTKLFDGMSQIYRTRMAKVNRLQGKNQLQDTKDQIALETMELFFNVLYYKGTVGLAKQQLEGSVDSLKKTQRMVDLGIKSIPDLAEIKAQEAGDRLALTQQKNLLDAEIVKLKNKMNFPVSGEFSIVDYDSTMIVGKTTDNAVDIYQHATSALPRLLASSGAVKSAEMQYKVARGGIFPKLSLVAGISTNFSRMMNNTNFEPFIEQFKNRRGAYVGFVMSVPIFNGFSASAEMKRGKQRLIMAQCDDDILSRQVYSDIEQAVADVNGLADEYLHSHKQTESMIEAHRVNLRKYQEGLIDAFEVSNSANRLLNARIEELYTNLKYQLKCELLKYYKGETSWIYN